MSFAFITVLLLLFSLPGIAFRRSYYASRFSLNFVSTNLINELIWSFIPALFLHAIAVLIIEAQGKVQFHVEHFGYLLVGGSDKEEIQLIFNNIHSNLGRIILYFTSLTLVAALVGNILRLCVRGLGLDILLRILRFPNRWHYLFTGEYLDIEKGLKYHKNIDFIIVDVLMGVGDKNIIYSGILEDYYLSKTSGGLDRIIIKYPSKKIFTEDGNSEHREIPGDYLSIPYEKILNINIQYYEFTREDEVQQEESVTSES